MQESNVTPMTKTHTHPTKLQAAAQQLQDDFDQAELENQQNAEAEANPMETTGVDKIDQAVSETLQETSDHQPQTGGEDKTDKTDLFEPTQYLADLKEKISNDEIKDFFDELEEIELKRQSLNERKASALQHLVDKGAERAGLNAAYQRYKQQNKTRQAKIDATFARCTVAVGSGYQTGLFDE